MVGAEVDMYTAVKNRFFTRHMYRTPRFPPNLLNPPHFLHSVICTPRIFVHFSFSTPYFPHSPFCKFRILYTLLYLLSVFSTLRTFYSLHFVHRIFYSPHFVHSAFFTLRIFYSPHSAFSTYANEMIFSGYFFL